MTRLRDPDGGCPWDVEQDFASIAPHTIEEAYEVADAIERQDMGDLRAELGDLLLQVVFHAQIAREDGLFQFDDVAAAICDKLVRRHPHVFGDLNIDDAETQTVAWEDLKANERKAKAGGEQATSALAGVTVALPALTRALKLQKRAARVGFDWDGPADVMDKLHEEIGELQAEMMPDADPAPPHRRTRRPVFHLRQFGARPQDRPGDGFAPRQHQVRDPFPAHGGHAGRRGRHSGGHHPRREGDPMATREGWRITSPCPAHTALPPVAFRL